MSDWPRDINLAPSMDLSSFCSLVTSRGLELYRDLPWRRTHDPYGVWVSEVMLQQTQVARVDGRWQRWLARFPTVEALALAEQADVLEEWQGMGYNRRALSLLRAAREIAETGKGFPHEEEALLALPGIGPATAAGIRAFAFNLPGVYLETNVRAVFLHDLFPNETNVSDRSLVPLVRAACPIDTARDWYYALLDYGAWLKRTVPNPSRRSKTHVRQTSFVGSHRQKRAIVVRILLSSRPDGIELTKVSKLMSSEERASGRPEVSEPDTLAILEELEREGFCRRMDSTWFA